MEVPPSLSVDHCGQETIRNRKEILKMHTLRNKLIALAAVVILAVVGTLLNSHQAAAQDAGPPGGLAVNVVNSIPQQVTGTVGLTSGASVRVNNTVTDPVRVRNVNDAIQPFTASGTCSPQPNVFGCTGALFT